MPPPAPLPSGRVVLPLSFVPARYSSSPECRYPPQTAPGSASPGLGSPAQLPSPRCFPSSSGLCVSPALVRPATACPRVSPAPCLPYLGLCPSLCLCLSHPHLVPSLRLFLPLSVGHTVSTSMSPSFPPSIPPSSHLFSASPCHAISAPLYGHVSNPISVSVASLFSVSISVSLSPPPLSLPLVSPPPCVSAPSSPLLLLSASPGDLPCPGTPSHGRSDDQESALAAGTRFPSLPRPPLSHLVRSLLSPGSSSPHPGCLLSHWRPHAPCRVLGQARPLPLPQWAPPTPLLLPQPGLAGRAPAVLPWGASEAGRVQ